MKRKYFAALFLAITCVMPMSVPAIDDKDKLPAAEIIEKHLAAVGGKESLARFKTRVAIGVIKMEDEPENKMAIMSEAPNRLSAFYAFRSYDLHWVYDGSKTILRPTLPRQVATIEDKYRAMLASGLMFNSMSLYNLLAGGAPVNAKLETKGMKKVNGRQAYVVEIKRGKADPMRLYFDVEDFMWVRTDYGRAEITRQMGTFTNDVVNQGGSEASIDFYIETSDFKTVDGVKLPFKFEQVVTAPILRDKAIGTIIGKITEYRHNVPIDPKMFQ